MQCPEIDDDIPMADYPPTYADLRERVDAAFATLDVLAQTEFPDGVPVTEEDKTAARAIFAQTLTPTAAVLSSPGTVVHIKAILSEYDHAVVESAVQLRNYVTNRLIEDSTNADPRIRLRCYELLGKISDVGLFTDKTEVTLRHRPTEELEQLLRERIVNAMEGEYSREQAAEAIMPDLTPPNAVN